MESISPDHLRSYRLWKNRLTKTNAGTGIYDVVREAIAFPASNIQGLYIGLYNRMHNISRQSIEKYLYNNNISGRFSAMRGETYLIHKNNFETVFSGTYNARENKIKNDLLKWDIEEPEYLNIARKILTNLSTKTLNYSNLQKSLPVNDIRQIKIREDKSNISSTNFDRVFMALLDRWQVVHSWEKWKSNGQSYCLFDTLHSPRIFTSDYAKMECTLIEQYIDSYGPVMVDEIAWWCDLSKNRVEEIIELPETNSKFEEIEITGNNYYIAKSEIEKFSEHEIDEEDKFHLLGENDPLLLSYPFDETVIAEEYWNLVFKPAGGSLPSVILNGKVIGNWSFKETKSRMNLSISIFRSVKTKQENKLFQEIDRMADFLCDKEKSTNVEIEYK